MEYSADEVSGFRVKGIGSSTITLRNDLGCSCWGSGSVVWVTLHSSNGTRLEKLASTGWALLDGFPPSFNEGAHKYRATIFLKQWLQDHEPALLQSSHMQAQDRK